MAPETPANFDARVSLLDTGPGEDGGLAAATALLAELDERGVDGAPKAAVAHRVARACFHVCDYARAKSSADVARKAYFRAEDAAGLGLCDRTIAAALMFLGNWELAFRILDRRMQTRGPTLGGLMGRGVFARKGTAKEAAIDEARAVSMWASNQTPEWTRALGGMAEAFSDEPAGAELLQRFNAGLVLLAFEDNAEEGFDLIIRQLEERNHRAALWLAKNASRDRA